MTVLDIEQIKSQLITHRLAGHIHQQNSVLVLQEPIMEDGTAYHVFAQHELSGNQVGLQFGIRVNSHSLSMLVGITHSNPNSGYEIAIQNLKGEHRAFNLLYSFYNYPKGFYLMEFSLHSHSSEIERQLHNGLNRIEPLRFIQTAIKITPTGKSIKWIEQFIFEQILSMKVRIQLAIQT